MILLGRDFFSDLLVFSMFEEMLLVRFVTVLRKSKIFVRIELHTLGTRNKHVRPVVKSLYGCCQPHRLIHRLNCFRRE